MLNAKALLEKALTGLHVVNVESAQVTVAANGTAWITVDKPLTGEVIALSGFYIKGNGQRFRIFCSRLDEDQNYKASFAIANTTSTNTTLSIVAQYLVLGGVVNKLLRTISNLFREEVVVC